MLKGRLRRYYQTSTFYLEGLLRKGPGYHAAYLDVVTQYATPGARVLDLGVGTGASTRLLAGQFAVVGLDLSLLFLRWAAKAQRGRVGYVAGDAEKLPLDAAAFDLVGAFELIEHVENVHVVLCEIDRVLKPGGVIVFVSPNVLSPVNPLLNLLREARKRRIRLGFLGEALRSFYLTTAKLTIADSSFLMRDIPDHSELHSDMDACYLASPVDLKRWFQKRGYVILRYQRGGRTATGRFVNALFGSYAPSIYVVVRKLGRDPEVRT